MKRFITAVILIVLLSTTMVPFCHAAGENSDTLADWNIKIVVPDNTTAVLQGSEYYIYAKRVGSIPYVMLRVYRYDSEEKFISDFTEYMQKQHADLKITAEAREKTIGEKSCYEIDYTYKVSGYDVTDRRIVFNFNGKTYMFASKEVPSLKMTIGNMLEEVVANCVLLENKPNPVEKPEEDFLLSGAYLYRQENGMPKYWLDFSGALTGNPVLHCYFRSGEPTFYENWYVLDLDTAETESGRIIIRKILNQRGIDISSWFRSVVIEQDGSSVVLLVDRDTRTLAGGSEDNLITGEYTMDPVAVKTVYEYYQDSQLKYWINALGEDIEFHAMLPTGSGSNFEEVFLLDSKTSESAGKYGIAYKKILNSAEEDVSKWFRSLTFTDVQGAILMNLERDERTLTGGIFDSIETGTYMMEPHTYPLLSDQSRYSANDIMDWSRIHYFLHNGIYLEKTEIKRNNNGTYSVHMFNTVDLDGAEQTVASVWYTIDKKGNGKNDATGQTVTLFR